MNSALRVLHVEDQERDVALLKRHLSRAGYEPISERVQTPNEMKAALEAHDWDVILYDYSMPHFNALTALALVKEMGLDIPFIIISGTVGAAVAVEAMRAGANDYLMKDNLVRLAPTIERELQEAENRRARWQAEEALKASEAELRALLAAMTDVIFVLDAVGRYSRIAPTSPTHLYKPSADLIGKTLHEVFPKEQADLFLGHIRRALAEGRTHRVEYSLQLGETDVWFDGSVSPMSKDSVVWIARDITERKRAEDERERFATEVERQRQHLKELVAHVPGVVWEASGAPDETSQSIVFVNDYTETMLGYSIQEWLQTPNFWLSIVHEEDQERVAREAAAIFAGGRGGTGEFRWISRDGRILWVEAQFVVIRDEAGTPIGMRGVTMDITERKRAEEELRESEERYRDTVENARDMIYTHDLEGNYTSINKAGEQITGYTRAEVRRLNLAQTIAPEYLEKARQMIARKLAGDEETVYDLEIIAKDGRRIAVEVNTRLVYRDGIAVGVQGIARDVTERRHLEEQLRQSQKIEAVGRLAGGIAHDFNNLLTVINGYSELTIRRLQPEDASTRNLEEIKRAGSRAASLTRQLLAFSRKQVLQPKVLDLNAVISDLEKMLQRLIGEDIDLRTVLKPELRRVNADPGQIEQVIMNLVVNARDAMPDGGNLTIKTENVYLTEEYSRHHVAVKPGAYVMLVVSDNGLGMNDETKARLFEPFFTTKDQGKGTGLGLSTVYGIVKQSMGNIWVYSEVGLGTTFKVYLPCVDDEVDNKQPSQSSQPIALGSGTVLLVEDDEMVRGLTRTTLEEGGYKVIQAANGAEAVLICEQYQEPIHLLLTDVVMPGMSGRAVADRLKTLRPQMLVLYMSGYTEDAIVHRGVLNEGVNFIEKPFAPAALTRKVREVLNAA
jgi:two-component system, cell cycle sensor histidine kinase and response regulator CckA